MLTPENLALGLTTYIVLLFSLSVHESAHGWMASRMGDDTARAEGRVSLNPLVHIDPIGTVLVPLIQIFSSGNVRLLGWAKPTPVAGHNLRKLSQGHILVAGAGPVSNMLLALLFTGALFFLVRGPFTEAIEGPVGHIVLTGIQMNVGLAVFNLVPLPPLDGSWIASWGLPRSIANHYDRIMEPWGQWILLLLFMTRVLDWVTAPLNYLVLRFLYALLT